MKKRIHVLILSLIVFPGLLLAQQERAPSKPEAIAVNLQMARQPNTPNPVTNAVFDLQFDNVLPRGGFAGITWTYNNFWVSKWASDSVFVVDDTTGAILSFFFIPGVTGIRGMTFDGTSVWVANNTTSIFKVDTGTHAILDTIIAPLDVRGLAYDSSANSGAGGLWVANYATDISLIDYSGNTLNTILAGSHGLTGMYGIAFDPYSTGGPYIWAFDQGVAGTAQNFVRISIATGMKDVVHDVGLEIGGAGISGGMSITGFTNPGPHTLLGLSQVSPDRVFGLELADYTPPAFDASSDSINFLPAFTLTPAFLVAPINWDVVATNNGSSQLDSINANVTVNDGASNVFTDSYYSLAVPSLGTTTISMQNTFTPAALSGTDYTATAVINTGSQTDVVSSNDTVSYSFSITDTTLGRSGIATGSIGIGNGTGGSLGVMYDIPIISFATSLTFALNSPTLGDSVKAELFDWNGSAPNNLIASSATYIFTAADTGGTVITLPYLNAPVQLNPGTYVACIHEYSSNITVRYSVFNWRPNSSWIFIAANGWAPSENYSFKIVPLVFLNVWSQSMVSVPDFSKNIFSVYPSPSTTHFILDFPKAGTFQLTVADYSGKIIYTKMLDGIRSEAIRTADWSNGLYLLDLESEGNHYYSKVVVAH